jgi:hypothetical protein
MVLDFVIMSQAPFLVVQKISKQKNLSIPKKFTKIQNN